MKNFVSKALALCAAVLFCPWALAQQYGAPPAHWFFAIDYATSNLQGQAPNSYVWNLASTGPGSCVSNPNGAGAPFFVFGPSAHPFPEYIQDYSSANSEVVTPSSSTLTGSNCGFAASTSHQHYTFWVKSGTGGLYEALVSNVGASHVVTVFVDAPWYTYIGSLPNSSTLAGLLAALPTAFGSSNVQIADTTTAPWTFYTWNGASYVQTYQVSQTLTSGSPATTGSIVGQVTSSAATVTGAGSNSIAGIRGLVTINSSTNVSSGYWYGTQGKAIIDGSIINIGSNHLAGVYAQLSANGTTVTSGHVAIIIASGQNLPASSNVDGIYVESGAGPINSWVKGIINANYAFDLSKQSGANYAQPTSSTGSGQCKQSGLVAQYALAVHIDGTNYWIPLCTAL